MGKARKNLGVLRPGLPDSVDKAIDATGNRVRVLILESLLREGPATRAELSRRLEQSTSLLQAHLRTLEELRVVYTSPPRSDRESNRLRRSYHVDMEYLGALVSALGEFLQPPSNS